ncbi:MAG: hypothetical protein LBL13_13245 [Bacteroidales bacterium]|jgi:hypothetical protein|nr:hypothetical protein [Bacteroidales bacterium]
MKNDKDYKNDKYFTPKEVIEQFKKEPLVFFFFILILILLPLALWFWDGTVPFYCGLSVFLE